MFEVLTERRLSVQSKNIVYYVTLTKANMSRYLIRVKRITINDFYYATNGTKPSESVQFFDKNWKI